MGFIIKNASHARSPAGPCQRKMASRRRSEKHTRLSRARYREQSTCVVPLL